MIIDTHTHIYLPNFKDTIDEVMARANTVGVSRFYLPAIDSTSFDDLLQLENKYPLQCFAMAGLHPCSVGANVATELNYVHQQLQQRKFVAIGEIGLDLYWDKTYEQQQLQAFTTQMQWALEYNIPISIHTRNAMALTIQAVKPFANKGLRGIFHCFGGSIETANEIINMGFLLGIGGVITYKNAGLAEVVTQLNVKHLVLETDAPYLTPVPNRSKPNEPSYLVHIIEKIAILKNISVAEVAQATTANALQLFHKS